jgi:phosphoglycolate phosphatase
VYALIAFDLDGVLYSSEPFLGAAYRDAIANVNAQRPGSFPRVPTTREILDHVGWPVPVILERLFPAVDPVAVELLYTETLDVIGTYVRRGQGVLFPGVAETLGRLRAAGFTLVIASNGRLPYIAAVLEANGLVPYFAELLTVDREGMKTKADLLRAYRARYALPADQLVMIGDRASDVEAAVAVGCRFIGCDYGHGYRHEIQEAGPMVSAFDQLPAVIAQLLARET